MDSILSYAHAPSTKPYVYKTHMQMLNHWAILYPEKEAFVQYDSHRNRTSLTCRQLLEQSRAFGYYVSSLGVRKGDIVTFSIQNSLNMLIGLFGVQFAGGIPISSMQSKADGTDIIDTIREQNSKLLIMDAKHGEESWETLQNILSDESIESLSHIVYNDISSEFLHYNFGDKCTTVVDLTETEEAELPNLYPDDIAVYYKTSGSTGKPKLVGHTHFGYFNNTYTINECLELVGDSRFFCDRPFGWGVGSPRTFLASGATRVFADSTPSIQQNNIVMLADIIFREKCTHLYLPGYLASDLWKSDGLEVKFSTVKAIICAGERISKRYTELLGRYCERLVIWYGSTEAAGVSAFSSKNAKDYADGIIGKPLPGIEMKIVDDEGKVVPRGVTGELYVRSAFRFIEYKDMPNKFLATVDNENWLHTGDLCHVRGDGNVVLNGRTGEQMSIGGMKVFPKEIERVLIECKEIDTVIVVPVPDERLYHAICACVVLTETATNDLQATFSQLWADNALLKPKYYLAFKELPKNASGKFDREKIASIATARLNLH